MSGRHQLPCHQVIAKTAVVISLTRHRPIAPGQSAIVHRPSSMTLPLTPGGTVWLITKDTGLVTIPTRRSLRNTTAVAGCTYSVRVRRLTSCVLHPLVFDCPSFGCRFRLPRLAGANRQSHRGSQSVVDSLSEAPRRA